jgi:hypothetical protein
MKKETINRLNILFLEYYKKPDFNLLNEILKEVSDWIYSIFVNGNIVSEDEGLDFMEKVLLKFINKVEEDVYNGGILKRQIKIGTTTIVYEIFKIAREIAIKEFL